MKIWILNYEYHMDSELIAPCASFERAQSEAETHAKTQGYKWNGDWQADKGNHYRHTNEGYYSIDEHEVLA